MPQAAMPSEPGATRPAPCDATWRLVTPASRSGAIAIVQISGEVNGAMSSLGLGEVPVGSLVLRDFGGVDRGLVARVRPDLLLLMPHGGRQVLLGIAAWLDRAGLSRDCDPDPFPDARSGFEARLLSTLARAASPLAIDLLLDQPRRWREWGDPDPHPDAPAPDPEHSRLLRRLVDPPLVVAAGASNIGKSTLLNRLAGRSVASVADEPGTTRDHVGALLDLGGLVVRYVDTPGVREGAPRAEVEAGEIARSLLPEADLVLLLGDASSPPPALEAVGPRLRVALRVDLGEPPWESDACVCALSGTGMADLVGLLRETLVPAQRLASPLPWRFWESP